MRDKPVFGPAERANAETLISLAIEEDFGRAGDITAEVTIPADAMGQAVYVARSPGVVAGLPVAGLIAERMGLSDGWKPLSEDGLRVDRGAVLARVEGPMRRLLGMERISLNFLQRLSGIATLTNRFVAAVVDSHASILDTRKTTPGWRILEKYAVRCGGGRNHRVGLYDAILIKDNHLAWLAQFADPIGVAIRLARQAGKASHAAFVEVEVDTLDQLDQALKCVPDIILVDNFGPTELAEAVHRRDAVAPSVLLEASGGIRLETVAALATSGVDRISVGALTHSAPALDIGLDYES